jgi:phosphopantothenoylcysteine decarboxylase/phosphopantothenate--cysteine ligase
MTEHAKQFIHPNTFAALSGHSVYDDCFENMMVHIELAKWADKIIIAPTTANMMAKLHYGLAEDLLTTVCLATEAPIFIAPAMNKIMWQNQAVQHNLSQLKQKHFQVIEPTAGEQACGDIGVGRMAEPADVFTALTTPKILTGSTLLISAGPTREKIDPIRYLSNLSSGKMGYALAKQAKLMGAKVILVSGPTCLKESNVDRFIAVESAKEMLNAVTQQIKQADVFISAAAVADYTPTSTATHKIKKSEDALTIKLDRTEDILLSVKDSTAFKVGFCAETEGLIAHAKAKLIKKDLDVIVANQVENNGYPMGAENNELVFITKEKVITMGKGSKMALAQRLLELVIERIK